MSSHFRGDEPPTNGDPMSIRAGIMLGRERPETYVGSRSAISGAEKYPDETGGSYAAKIALGTLMAPAVFAAILNAFVFLTPLSYRTRDMTEVQAAAARSRVCEGTSLREAYCGLTEPGWNAGFWISYDLKK